MQYRREIDGLRAVAVLPVILFHAGFSVFSGGYVGVDVFFVISGYLITSILTSELEKGNFSILRFYERRARRILPALFFVMLACLPFAYMWMLPSQLEDFAQSLVAVVFFGSNILFWRESGYFGADAELKPLLHTWSLAVEEQYYVIFPIFLLLAWRFGRNRVFWSIVAIAVFSLILSEWGWRNAPSANFYLAPTRAWELLAGSMCAFLTVGQKQRSSNFLSALGLALILFAIFYYDETTPFPSAYALAPVTGTALIILFADKATWIARLLSTRGFVGIGLISYSAYLWHQPLFAFGRLRSLTEPGHYLMAVLAAAALLLAWATWRWVEQPFRNRAHPILVTQRGVFAASGAVGTVFIAIGLVGHFGDGLKWRFQADINIVGDYGQSEFHRVLDDDFVDCEPANIAETALRWNGYLRCKQTKPGFSELVLFGDSHAEHLFYGLAGMLDDENLAFYIKNGSPFLSNNDFSEIFEELIGSEKERTVLISMHYARFPEADDARVHFEDELEAVVLRLVDAGHSVVLLENIPSFLVGPEHCIMTGQRQRCTMNYDNFVSETEDFHAMLRAVANRTNVPVLSLAPSVCQDETCSMFNEDSLLYRDSNHLSLVGSQVVGQYLANLLKTETLSQSN